MILLIVASRHCGSSAPPSSGLLLLRAICAFSAPECISTELQNWLSWCRFGATIILQPLGPIGQNQKLLNNFAGAGDET
jgi:hypothetical protein